MRVDENTKEVLKTWPLTTVRRWAASPNSFTLVSDTHSHTHTHTHTHSHTHTHTLTLYIYTYTQNTYTHTHSHTFTHTCTCIYSTYIHTHSNSHTHKHPHTHTHTHTHTRVSMTPLSPTRISGTTPSHSTQFRPQRERPYHSSLLATSTSLCRRRSQFTRK